MDMKLQETVQGVVLVVHVKPGSKEFRLQLDEDELVVLCREAPVKGKVNKELLKQFSRLFGRKVELVSGFTSRQKRFLISDIESEEVNRILVSALGTR
ncbi:YggU family protein [Candidatus Bathyarchaeota archaeon]|nr:MAG: YggU family protein [Candidatus Bathyarchaeota archaeon]